jgi:O-6-methylguanine DNA methyltransferase
MVVFSVPALLPSELHRPFSTVMRLSSPWGILQVVVSGTAVTHLILPVEPEGKELVQSALLFDPAHPVALAMSVYCAGQVDALNEIAVEFPLHSTGFQQRVWQAACTIPPGETRSYQWLAETVGCPRGMQAVGGALRANPVPLIVPCHRIVRKSGHLGGFMGYAETDDLHPALRLKQALLTHEQRFAVGLS